MDKTKIFEKLLQAHDDLYDAREKIEDLRVSGEVAEYMSGVLQSLDRVELLIDQVIGSTYWKRLEKEPIEHSS